MIYGLDLHIEIWWYTISKTSVDWWTLDDDLMLWQGDTKLYIYDSTATHKKVMSQVLLKFHPIAKRCLELQEECVTFSEPNKLLMKEFPAQVDR